MNCHVELHVPDPLTRHFFEARLQSISTPELRWRAWAEDTSTAPCPDVTIIDASRIGWYEVGTLANASHADCVLLWGVDKPILGLACLPQYFGAEDLLALVPRAQAQLEAAASSSAETPPPSQAYTPWGRATVTVPLTI